MFSVADDETETRELFCTAAAQTYPIRERRLEKIRQGAFATGREAYRASCVKTEDDWLANPAARF